MRTVAEHAIDRHQLHGALSNIIDQLNPFHLGKSPKPIAKAMALSAHHNQTTIGAEHSTQYKPKAPSLRYEPPSPVHAVSVTVSSRKVLASSLYFAHFGHEPFAGIGQPNSKLVHS